MHCCTLTVDYAFRVSITVLVLDVSVLFCDVVFCASGTRVWLNGAHGHEGGCVLDHFATDALQPLLCAFRARADVTPEPANQQTGGSPTAEGFGLVADRALLPAVESDGTSSPGANTV
jgi:hypothetical protein